MKKNTVTLAQVGSTITKETPPMTVDGYSPDNDTALIVHKAVDGPGWNITHQSGWAILKHLNTRAIALFVAEEMGWLANWSNITQENALEWYKIPQNKEGLLSLKRAGAWNKLEDVKAALTREKESRKLQVLS